MKLGLSGFAYGKLKLPLEEMLDLMDELDIRNLELVPGNVPTIDTTAKGAEWRYESKDVRHIIETVSSHGINLVCLTMNGAFDQELASDVTEYAAALKYTVELAAELGVKLVNHYTYYLCPSPEADIAKLERCWKPAIETAEKLGITLVLENEPIDAGGTPGGMLELLNKFRSPAFRTNYDATNYYQGSVEAYPYGYELLKDYISHVHIKNGCIFLPDAGHDEIAKGRGFVGAFQGHSIYYPILSEGAVNNDSLLSRLIADGYNGYCVMEPHVMSRDSLFDYARRETGYLRGRKYF